MRSQSGRIWEVVAYRRSEHRGGGGGGWVNFESCEPVVISLCKAPINAKYCIVQGTQSGLSTTDESFVLLE